MEKANKYDVNYRIKECIIMDNNILKYIAFLRTVEKGNISSAAESLSYAQSTVSKMIADLENECGTTLLERGKTGVHLTTSGEQILPYFRKIVNDFEEMGNYVDSLNGLQSGIVRIGTFSSVAINWLPNIFAEFQKDYPLIDYELMLGDYDEVEKWIKEGRVDCGFISLPSSDELDTILLKNDEYKVVLPKNHPLAQNSRINIHDLNEQTFLLLENGGHTEVTKLLEQYKITPKIRFTLWEDFAIMAMVEKGMGVSILPDMILKRIPYDIVIRPLEIPFYREIGIAMKDKESITQAAKKFLEYLKYRENCK